ncbi:type I restriction enzyme HsdR N-terminal domain-containing protein [Aquimarina agarivorans]|uniref:type I restriction enzyme HsdR N-terminal domain-containing protein n=1 Tax=Aquimarina agarivorans TaxID=980584 RepID=UPI000248F2EF|nr:type I restriction enzyme HsdR N-terminal domain-containing protein [Aquimarina agarivorans]
MQQLAFPAYTFRVKNSENKTTIFDIVRKKFVVLTPEEWVRQHVLHQFIFDKKYPLTLINVEKEIKVNNTRKRYDIVVYNPSGSIHILVECKAPKIKITQQTFDQVARYNLTLKGNYQMVTNGLEHYFCQIDYENEAYHFIPELPPYSSKILDT